MPIQHYIVTNPSRKRYTKPQLLRKGTIATLTRKAGGSSDSGIPGVFTP
jgi:hypothetical protein